MGRSSRTIAAGAEALPSVQSTAAFISRLGHTAPCRLQPGPSCQHDWHKFATCFVFMCFSYCVADLRSELIVFKAHEQGDGAHRGPVMPW